jgi:hypothetical protein
MRSFRDFYENKVRLAIKQLNIVAQVVEKAGFKVDHFLDEQFTEPYVFIHNPEQNTSFEGVRLYRIGDKIAYRIQRENKTHPYGNAYTLDVELMFDDLMEEGDHKPEEIGKKVMEMVAKELRTFFKESASAEKDKATEDMGMERDGLGTINVRNPQGGDANSMTQDSNQH